MQFSPCLLFILLMCYHSHMKTTEAEYKTCSLCHEAKTVDHFAKASKNADGMQRWCNECRSLRRSQLACQIEVTEKRCKDCGETKPSPAFHRSNIMKDGLQARCIACHKLRYGVGTEESNQRRSEARFKNWPAAIVRSCGIRAQKTGVPFALKAFDVIIPDRCPVLGIPLILTRGKVTPNSPSIDRLIPELGYVPSNIRVISWRANKIKSDESNPEVFERIAAYIRSYQ